MDRRGFLKNIFGAAVVAAIPKIVLKQIDDLPKHPITSPVNGIEPIFIKEIPTHPNGLLYIWDDEKNALIGASKNFSLNFRQGYVDVSIISDGCYAQYLPGPKSWDISASNIQWVGNAKESFEQSKKLRCLIAKDDIRINGEIYITQLASFAPLNGVISYDAKFEGNGELIIKKDE